MPNQAEISKRLCAEVSSNGNLKKKEMAGEEGFEPSNAGIRIRCLNQLGDSPVLRKQNYTQNKKSCRP